MLIKLLNVFLGVVVLVVTAIALRCLFMCVKSLPERFEKIVTTMQNVLWLLTFFAPLAMAHAYFVFFKTVWEIFSVCGAIGFIVVGYAIKACGVGLKISSLQTRAKGKLLHRCASELVLKIGKIKQQAVFASHLKLSSVILQ